jgi:hypothetical protein
MASMMTRKIIKNTYRHFFNWFGQVTADRNYSQKLFWIDQVTNNIVARIWIVDAFEFINGWSANLLKMLAIQYCSKDCFNSAMFF